MGPRKLTDVTFSLGLRLDYRGSEGEQQFFVINGDRADDSVILRFCKFDELEIEWFPVLLALYAPEMLDFGVVTGSE